MMQDRRHFDKAQDPWPVPEPLAQNISVGRLPMVRTYRYSSSRLLPASGDEKKNSLLHTPAAGPSPEIYRPALRTQPTSPRSTKLRHPASHRRLPSPHESGPAEPKLPPSRQDPTASAAFPLHMPFTISGTNPQTSNPAPPNQI